jgi:probable phosphoglycerate mutase
VLVRCVYVVTHPEATHHVEGVVGGWHDSQLTPAGIRAAARIAGTLRDRIPADAEVEVISSDLRRTLRTAEEAAKSFGVETIEDRRLRERSYGQAEGRAQEWLDRRFVPPPATGDRMGHDIRVSSGSITTLREDDYFHSRQVVGLGETRHLDS